MAKGKRKVFYIFFYNVDKWLLAALQEVWQNTAIIIIINLLG